MPGDPKSLWDSFWPVGAVFGGALSFIFSRKIIFNREIWKLIFRVGSSVTADDDSEEERKSELKRRETVRRIDSRASIELQRCYDRIDSLEKENEELRTMRALWEGRARRADEIAHNMRHQWANERYLLHPLDMPDVPRIPLLEDPL